ncbi:hypothetical protein GCM10010218_54760 [Streptomyces mashuensis]|uniref:Uncharacterized protein n=1 Tax=Streptomyces mashuensis TaxID=33904 RepID=A0A919B9C2_9ACTN|nr:hypothetical protein [Streptomyces mashuensis]GHF66275.1 hypothetical protein GCM10010218_54760 [Streptomyces mashuensis]
MSVKSRIATAAVLTAAVAAVAYPTAGAFAAGRPDTDTRPHHSGTTTQQVMLPDGSRARLTTGSEGTSVVVLTRGKLQRIINTHRPAADLDRLHLRIIGGDTSRPTLRAQLDGARLTHYYDFASGSLRHTLDGSDHGRATTPGTTLSTYRATTSEAHPAGHTGDRPATATTQTHKRPPHDSSGNPVKRVVEAGQVIKASHDAGDVRTPVLYGGAALLAAGAGAYGVRLAVRRTGRGES